MKNGKKYIDLHVHTNASDGAFSAEEIVAMARKAGLSAIAVTDHDSIDGVKLAVGEGKKLGVEVIQGVELTVDDDKNKIEDIHILGLFVNVDDENLKYLIQNSKKERLKQKKEIIKKLKKLGYKIDFEDVRKITKGCISRLHIAKALLEKNKEVGTAERIFKELIGVGKIAYAKRKNKLSIKKAVSAIHRAGGISILSHPYLYDINLDYLIEVFLGEGGDGIEVFYPYDGASKFKDKSKKELDSMEDKLKAIVVNKGFIVSGGSDFHGDNKNAPLGSFKVPYSVLEKLKRFNNGG